MVNPSPRILPRAMRAICSLASAVVLLAACGGGGGGDGVALEFPVDSAVSAYATSAHNSTLTGSLAGASFAVQYTYAPGAPAVFRGINALTARTTLVLSVDSVVAEQSTTTTFFSVNPYVEYGAVDQDTGAYAVFNATGGLPVSARIGQSGVLGTEVTYSDASLTVLLGSTNVTWTMEADAGNPVGALFCVNVQAAGGIAVSGAQCYKVSTGGAVSGIVVRVTVAGQTLILS